MIIYVFNIHLYVYTNKKLKKKLKAN